MPDQMTTPQWAESYRQHATNLRTWFVAFGIGAPVLLLSNEHVWRLFAASPEDARAVGSHFLVGIVLQLVLAIIDKYADWWGYTATILTPGKSTLKSEVADWWLRHDLPSILADAATILLFVVGTSRLVAMLLPLPR